MGVEFFPGHVIQRAEGNDVILVSSLSGIENRVVGVNALVFAGNNRADDELYLSLMSRVPQLYAIGDCVVPRRATEAIFEGQQLGSMI